MFQQFGFAGCGLAVLGLILAAAGLISLQPALRSLRWRAVEGTVTQAGSPTGQVPEGLRYVYSVGGRQYSGSRAAFQPLLSGGHALSELYQTGQPVTVYYDPGAPDRSVLRPGPGMLAYLPLAAGSLLFLLGLIFGMMAFVVY